MHNPSSLLFLLLIPIIIWNMRRRLHGVRKRADHWFQPSGENFIYQPRGRWGHAFIVSAEDREIIKRKMASLWVGILSGLSLVYIMPLLLVIGDGDDYLQYQRQMIWYRLGVVAVVLLVALIWHRLTIWPIYASAERSGQRISVDHVRAKIAADTGWAMIVSRIVLFVAVLAGLTLAAWVRPSDASRFIYIAGGVFCGWGLVRTIRLALAKRDGISRS